MLEHGAARLVLEHGTHELEHGAGAHIPACGPQYRPAGAPYGRLTHGEPCAGTTACRDIAVDGEPARAPPHEHEPHGAPLYADMRAARPARAPPSLAAIGAPHEPACGRAPPHAPIGSPPIPAPARRRDTVRADTVDGDGAGTSPNRGTEQTFAIQPIAGGPDTTCKADLTRAGRRA